MEGKIVEISALHSLAIGRLLWETLYIYYLIKQLFWNTLYCHVILDDSRFSLVVNCHQSILCSWKYFLMRSLSIFYPSSHLSLSKFDFLYFLRSIKPSALFASLGFLSFDKPIFQWFQYYKHYIYRIESKQIFAPHHIKHKAKMNNLLAFFLFGAFCFNHLNKFHFPFICSFNFCLLFAQSLR